MNDEENPPLNLTYDELVEDRRKWCDRYYDERDRRLEAEARAEAAEARAAQWQEAHDRVDHRAFALSQRAEAAERALNHAMDKLSLEDREQVLAVLEAKP